MSSLPDRPRSSSAALVTGGARRLGRVIALELARQGYDIALHYHRSQAEAEKTRGEIRALDVACELLRHDLADAAGLSALAEQAVTFFPHLNALVNNASIFERAPFREAGGESFDRHMAVNLKAPVFLTKAFAEQTAGEGAVVNLLDSRITARKHSYFYYLLSKKALHDFTRMAAAELGPRVRVNAVAPGSVMESVDGNFDEARIRRDADTLPLKRDATPEEVARAVHYLLSTPSLTGQVIFVDGGRG